MVHSSAWAHFMDLVENSFDCTDKTGSIVIVYTVAGTREEHRLQVGRGLLHPGQARAVTGRILSGYEEKDLCGTSIESEW